MGRLGLAFLKQESLNLLEDGQACGLRAVEATCGDHIGLQLQAFLIRIAEAEGVMMDSHELRHRDS